MKKIMLVLVICIMLTSMLVAETKKTVAVLEFEGGSGQDAITLADFFATELANKNVFTVLARSSVDAIMVEHKFQRSLITDTESIKAIGELVNADYIIVGKIATLGDSELLTVQMINVVSGQVEAGKSMPFEKIIQTLPSIKSMVIEITGAETGTKAEPTHAIGDRGPGEGLIFYIRGTAHEGYTYYECSRTLGEVNWEDANQLAKDYRGGGYDDWYLPNKEELNNIYENLVAKGFVEASKWFWSSSETTGNTNVAWIQYFRYGLQSINDETGNAFVRAVRAFNY